ncbi:MAG: hypothetical protein B6D61_05455 [Bacteroidetes bacterium 4484_249]|nr:MAG: hypothetical protein B6D61_05455 [Bacteroidetes bacterium 4484_249]
MITIHLQNNIRDNLKNIYGWKTHRKIIVFSVDDYGNIRVDSPKARKAMDKIGLKTYSRFDAFDALETKEDLEMLYESLSSVKDKNGNHAVFTPLTLPCNINFEKLAEHGYTGYEYELLPETFAKLSTMQHVAYQGAWVLWQEGVAKGLMAPQFHGREHFNLKVFKEKLAKKDHEVITALKNRSYTSISNTGYPTISYTAAFEFWDIKENDDFKFIIKDGLNAFEKVFGYRAVQFNPPGGREHPVIHKYLKDSGIKYLDTPFLKKEHLGKGKYKKILNYTGKKNKLDMYFIVRNVVFEPANNQSFDWVNYTLKQIETAFRWHRPAIISSHRVNFCGHIDPVNRKTGISALKELLKKIVRKWPDVEFMAADELGDLIMKYPTD